MGQRSGHEEGAGSSWILDAFQRKSWSELDIGWEEKKSRMVSQVLAGVTGAQVPFTEIGKGVEGAGLMGVGMEWGAQPGMYEV